MLTDNKSCYRPTSQRRSSRKSSIARPTTTFVNHAPDQMGCPGSGNTTKSRHTLRHISPTRPVQRPHSHCSVNMVIAPLAESAATHLSITSGSQVRNAPEEGPSSVMHRASRQP